MAKNTILCELLIKIQKEPPAITNRVMSLAENFYFDKSASNAFD